MKKTTVTLYAAETELTASHVAVAIHGLPIPIYVRAEIGELDNATPLDGETVLNSVEIGDEDPDDGVCPRDDAPCENAGDGSHCCAERHA